MFAPLLNSALREANHLLAFSGQGGGQSVAQASRLRVLAASRRQKRNNNRARRPVNSQARTPALLCQRHWMKVCISFFAQPFCSIPKGLRHQAQGCLTAATLGTRWKKITTPKALWPTSSAKL